MPRSLVAAVLAAGVGLGPAAVSGATFEFALEFRFAVDAVNFTGDLSGLEIATGEAPTGPVESVSGSGAVSFVSELGGKDLAPESGQPLLGIYRVIGTGMTSPLALGSADLELGRLPGSELPPFSQAFLVFSFGGSANVPLDLFWSMTVEASGGEWGESAAQLGFSIFLFGADEGFDIEPLVANSLFGEGRSEGSGFFGYDSLVTPDGTLAFRIEVNARGSAQTTAPIPLPAGGWLLLSGLGALLLARRRRG